LCDASRGGAVIHRSLIRSGWIARSAPKSAQLLSIFAVVVLFERHKRLFSEQTCVLPPFPSYTVPVFASLHSKVIFIPHWTPCTTTALEKRQDAFCRGTEFHTL
jgi:hypothetical protein